MKILLRIGLAFIFLTSAAFADWVAFKGSQPMGVVGDAPIN